ncbi:MAG: tRNA (N6-threonylcarbamoyladenosine(37)-N6)-methyltransferase TrmO [Limnochordia bacterium]
MIQIEPIGYVHYRREVSAPKVIGPSRLYPFPKVVEIHIKEQYIDGLLRIEDCTYLSVLYWMNYLPKRTRLQGHRFGDETQPMMGSFATRSPYRPNPIGVTKVRLINRRANVITVEGLDAFAKTPVLDIKAATTYPCAHFRTESSRLGRTHCLITENKERHYL